METYTGKIFQSGGSQALRIPNGCKFPNGVEEVYIMTKGNRRIITEKRKSLLDFYMMDHGDIDCDFLTDREDLPPEDKELF